MTIKKIALGLLLAASPAYAAKQKDVSQLLDAIKADKKTNVQQSSYQGELFSLYRGLTKKIDDKEYRVSFFYQKGKKSELRIGIFKDDMLVETFTDKGLDGIVEDHMLDKQWRVVEVDDESNKPQSMTFGNNRTESNERFVETIQEILKTYKK